MDVKKQIETKLLSAFEPAYMEIIDESHQHSVPEGAQSHFKAVIVSEYFLDMHRSMRHKKVYRELLEELDGPIHALSIFTYTPKEWLDRGYTLPDSPACMGGSQFDSDNSITAG